MIATKLVKDFDDAFKKHDSNHVGLNTDFIQSSGLSCEAIGCFYMIDAMPEDWTFSVDDLCSLTPYGKSEILPALAELENTGYPFREALIDENGEVKAMNIHLTYTPVKK